MQRIEMKWLVQSASAEWIRVPETELSTDWIATSLAEVRPGCLYLEMIPDSAEEAYVKGAAAVLSAAPGTGNYPVAVFNSSPYDALCKIAAWYRRRFHARIIAVAGANGKTTVREMLYYILSKEMKVSRTRWEQTDDLGVPKTLLGLDDHDKCAIVEMGFTTCGSFGRFGKICRPSASIITGVGSAHVGSFGSKEKILSERLSLTDSMSADDPIILCADDPMLYELDRNMSGDVVYYGIDTPCDIMGKIIHEDRDMTVLDITGYGKTVRITLHLPGRCNCYNALAAYAASVLMGISEKDICSALEEFHPIPGRLSILTTEIGVTIIDDCWTSTPESVKEAAKYFSHFHGKRKIAVLGEMEDLGETSAAAHRAAGRRFAQAGADLILACGAYAAEIAEGAVPFVRTRVRTFSSSSEIAQYLRTDRRKGDVVLFKAGRKTRLENIVSYVYHDAGLKRISAGDNQ